MPPLTICSWNVNGLRAAVRTGDFQEWLASTAPDIAGLQEVKATPDQVPPELFTAAGYAVWWHPAERAGYSGTMLLSRVRPLQVRIGLGIAEYDSEGRVIEADFPGFTLLSAYFPNGGRGGDRMVYKLAFYDAFLAHAHALVAGGRNVVFMGDLNVAHTEIDIARPDENRRSTGFLPIEREWMDRVIAHGFADTFRSLNPEARDVYTYWDAWRERRARNIGWRIDYVCVSNDLLPAVRDAFVQPSVMGSDHCPVGIHLELPA
ncbi:MAG: exodeoxyribonuclease III [Tepidiformaceae bacterium]